MSAAIIGILAAAAGKVAETLGPLVSAYNNAPKHALTIYTEINHTRTILSGLEELLNNLQISSRRRKELIQVDHVLAALFDGVLLFSELESLVIRLGEVNVKRTVYIRAQWARHEEDLSRYVSRLVSFKVCMGLMLSILRW